MTSETAYRSAFAVALGTGLFTVWAMGALGIIGAEGDPADRMFLGVLAVALAGAIVARFRPAGMVRAMLVTAGATFLVGVIAIATGEHEAPSTSVVEIMGLCGMFATMWAGAAFLFRRASVE